MRNYYLFYDEGPVRISFQMDGDFLTNVRCFESSGQEIFVVKVLEKHLDFIPDDPSKKEIIIEYESIVSNWMIMLSLECTSGRWEITGDEIKKNNNLVFSPIEVHFDIDFSPASEEQRQYRLDRAVADYRRRIEVLVTVPTSTTIEELLETKAPNGE